HHSGGSLFRIYYARVHTVADVKPLCRTEEQHAELGLDYHGFTAADLDRPVVADNMSGVGTLGELIEALQATYTRSIGVQFMHIDSSRVRSWLQARMERTRNRLDLARDTQLR